MTIPVLIPWRTDNGHRETLWQHLQKHYWKQLRDYRIVEGSCDDGPFNRAQAVNNAALLAGDWDVAVIADADSWVPPHNLAAAIDKAAGTGKLVTAFDTVIELTEACTNHIVANPGAVDASHLDVRNIRVDKLARSSMLVVTRTLFDRAGGFDPQFQEWGGEDEAFWFACRVVAREPVRIPGPVWHLWHAPASNRDTPQYRENLRRWQRYARARNEQQLQHIRAQ